MTFKDVHVPRTDPPEATRALLGQRGVCGVLEVCGI
jgi:hypothetical protein